MKVLIVSRSFYPSNSPRALRATELAKEFKRQGHSVPVLCKKETDKEDELAKEYGFTIKDLGQLRWKAVKLKGKGASLMIRRFFKRFSALLLEYPDIELMFKVSKALKKESGFDLVISIAVPHTIHWGVARVWKKGAEPGEVWVADCGDPYMGAENDSFKKPFYFKFIENWSFRKCDYISVPTPGAIDAYSHEFHDKIKVIPQGFKFEDYDVSHEKPKNEIPKFAYAGSLIPGRRDPREMLDYLVRLKKDFKFYIYTNHKSLVTAYAEKSNGRIIISEYIPRKELLYRLSRMDFLVNLENIGKRQKPSKVIDYLISGRPILSVKTGELDKEKIHEFINGNYRQQHKTDNPEQYKINNIVRKFISLI